MGLNQRISDELEQIALYLEITGENPFKVKAFTSASFAIYQLEEELETILAQGRLSLVKGIGATIQEVIKSSAAEGKSSLLRELEARIPEGVRQMAKIKGLGPKKIAHIWQVMGISTPGELLYACNENRLAQEKGFGAKTQDTVRRSLEFWMGNRHRFHYAAAHLQAGSHLETLKKAMPQAVIEPAGAYRLCREIIESIDLVIDATSLPSNWQNILASNGWVPHAEDTWTWKADGIPTWLHISTNFYYDVWILSKGEGDTQVPDDSVQYQSLDAVWANIGLPCIPDELRDTPGYADRILQEVLPDLVDDQTVRGVVHAHSTWSDGAATIEKMAKASIDLGYTYLVLTDHSQSAFYANGLTEGRVEEQHREIDALNISLAPFRIFKGIESDILPNGNLDYDAAFLKRFEVVIASVHSQLRMTQADATARLIRAVENPYTTMLGHPTGRLLLIREGYPIDHKKVIEACAANNVAIEINAHPYRLDLDHTWIGYAREKGVMISINPDAHHPDGIKDIFFGIRTARRGWLTKEGCVNALGLEDFSIWLQKRCH